MPMGSGTGGRFVRYVGFSLQPGQPIGILLQTLISIDVDDHGLVKDWEGKHDILTTCPKETTRKGAHFIMKRTPLCDELGLMNSPPGHCDQDTGETLSVDIITRCSTGTGGVLCVAPSPDKTWVRPLQTTPVPDIPDSLARYIAALRKTGKAYPKHVKPPTIKQQALARDLRGAIQEDDITELLSMLGQEEWDDYDSWVGKGILLKGLGDRYKDIFLAFSGTSSAHDPVKDQAKWATFPAKSRLGLGTLHFKARRDSPEKYSEFKKRNLQSCLRDLEAKNVSHASIAGLFLALYPDQFVNVNDAGVEMYHFHEHRWCLGGKARIVNLLNNIVAPMIHEHAQEVKREGCQNGGWQRRKTQGNAEAQAAIEGSRKPW